MRILGGFVVEDGSTIRSIRSDSQSVVAAVDGEKDVAVVDGVSEVEGSDEDLGNAGFDVMDEMVELPIEGGLGEEAAGDERGGVEGADGLVDEVHGELTEISEELHVTREIDPVISKVQVERRTVDVLS